MNIEKIFAALEEDEDNSALGIICQQLEEQGYKVLVNSKDVSSEGFFENEYPEIETLKQVDITLTKKKSIEQKFSIEFIDFHEIVIKKTQTET